MWNHDPSQRTEFRGCSKVWHAFEINLYFFYQDKSILQRSRSVYNVQNHKNKHKIVLLTKLLTGINGLACTPPTIDQTFHISVRLYQDDDGKFATPMVGRGERGGADHESVNRGQEGRERREERQRSLARTILGRLTPI